VIRDWLAIGDTTGGRAAGETVAGAGAAGDSPLCQPFIPSEPSQVPPSAT
jgi:hypothetical protein